MALMTGAAQAVRWEAIDWEALRSLLADEQKQASVGRVGRAAFQALAVVAYAVPIVLSLVFLGRHTPVVILDVLSGWALDAKADVTRCLEQLLVVLGVALPLLFLVELPLISKAYRHWQLSRGLVAFRLLDNLLMARPRAAWWRWTKTVALLAALTALLSVFFASVPRWLRTGAAVGALGEAAVVLTVVVFLPSAIFFAELALRRLRARLDYLQEVVSLRQTVGADEPSTEIPASLACRLAYVQRARILRQIAAVLAAGGSRLDPGFALRKSAAASTVLNDLSAATQMDIERSLERLAARQDKAAPERGRPTVTVWVGAVAWRVEFHVDVAREAIEILSIESAGDPRQ
jgi:hypothetical protein